jgi:glycosyltransferase involved in cell wall biosynthesis
MLSKKKCPLVSVLITTYNQEDYIGDAIQSVLAQQDCDYELVVANDASTDNTKNICEQYATNYPDKIKIINQSYNKGCVVNTRDCLLAAKGKYIAICEGDDYWTDSFKLKKQIEILQINENVSMVHTGWTDYIQSTGQFKNVKNNLNEYYICEHCKGKESVEAIMTGNYRGIRFSSICFRKNALWELINGETFLSPLFSTPDIIVMYELAYKGILYYIPKSAVIYRRRVSSVSINLDISKTMNYLKGVLYINCCFLKRFGLSQSTKNHIIRNAFSGLFPFALKTMNFELAKELKAIARKNEYRMRIGQWLCYYGSKSIINNKIAKLICYTMRKNEE